MCGEAPARASISKALTAAHDHATTAGSVIFSV